MYRSYRYVTVRVDVTVAAAWPVGHKIDIRPRVTDTISQKKCLVDSGSAITAIAAGPDDVVNPALALAAANGSLIRTFGTRNIKLMLKFPLP